MRFERQQHSGGFAASRQTGGQKYTHTYSRILYADGDGGKSDVVQCKISARKGLEGL